MLSRAMFRLAALCLAAVMVASASLPARAGTVPCSYPNQCV
jgi:hypothetical protein